MANVKITELPVTTAVTGTDVLPVVQSSITKQIAVSNFFTNPEIGGVASFADGTEAAPSITNTGDSNTGVWFPAADTFAVSTGGVEALRVNSSQAVSFAVAPVMSALTASTALALNASKEVVSVTNTGTGNNVLSASPTLTGTVGMAAATLSGNLTLSAGTANGVLYLDGSKVATSGSALTFDGSQLGVGTASGTSSGLKLNAGNAGANYVLYRDGTTGLLQIYGNQSGFNGLLISGVDGQQYLSDPAKHIWSVSNSEQMRLTSTGLGIGTSSPGAKLGVFGDTYIIPTSAASTNGVYFRNATNATTFAQVAYNANNGELSVGTTQAYSLLLTTNNTTKATLDSSGNLGLGVTPSAWATSGTILKALQIGAAGSVAAGTVDASIHTSQNAYFDGTNWKYIQTATAGNYYINGNSHVWRIAPSGTAGNAISFTQAMTLDASGNLLVGTTSASIGASGRGVIEVNGTSDSVFASKVNGTLAAISGLASSTEVIFGAVTNVPVLFRTNNTERARITSGGDFVLGTGGTASANVRSIINGSSTTDYGGFIEFQNNGTAFAAVGDYKALGGGGSTALLLCKNSTGGVYLATSGATSWSAVSDENKKNIIENISDAAAKVSSLRAVIGTYKDDPNAERHPFLIAQDVQAVLPEAVTDNEGVLGLSYSDVIPLLVAAIKEQQALITALTARVAALEAA